MLLEKPSEGPRWPRGQKFALSQGGRDAHEAHRAAVASARGLSRSALEAALAAWAEPRQVQPGDGVVLGELRDRPRGLPEVTRGLESAGSSAAEVRAALGRLVAAGLVDPVPTSRAGGDPAPPGPWVRS